MEPTEKCFHFSLLRSYQSGDSTGIGDCHLCSGKDGELCNLSSSSIKNPPFHSALGDYAWNVSPGRMQQQY